MTVHSPWILRLLLAAVLTSFGGVAQAQYGYQYENDTYYDGDSDSYYDGEELSDLEYEPGEGLHEEEWYDPSDWFDTEPGISYERDGWNGVYGDGYDGYYTDGYYTDDWFQNDGIFNDWY